MADSFFSKIAEQRVLYYRPVFTVDYQPLPAFGREGAEDEDESEEKENGDSDEEAYSWSEKQKQPYIAVDFAHEPPPRGFIECTSLEAVQSANKRSELKLFLHDKNNGPAARGRDQECFERFYPERKGQETLSKIPVSLSRGNLGFQISRREVVLEENLAGARG
jgi:hypothetical protein